MKNTQDWHKDFFTNFYYELFMKRSAQKIAEEVNIIDELIGNKIWWINFSIMGSISL